MQQYVRGFEDEPGVHIVFERVAPHRT